MALSCYRMLCHLLLRERWRAALTAASTSSTTTGRGRGGGGEHGVGGSLLLKKTLTFLTCAGWSGWFSRATPVLVTSTDTCKACWQQVR